MMTLCEGTWMEVDDSILATIDRIKQRNQERLEAFHRWAQEEPQTMVCDAHDHVGTIDWEKSYHATAHLRSKGRPDANILIYTSCPACEKNNKCSQQGSWLIKHGVPSNMVHACFSSYIPKNISQEKALAKTKAFATKRKGFLILQGARKGIGKSHLAISVMREMAAGRFITHAKIMEKVSDRYDDKLAEGIVPALQRTRLLVLDELGVSRGGNDDQLTLYSILSHRYNESLPTIITTNLDVAGFTKCVGERMSDRLAESCWAFCEMIGESERGKLNDGYFEDLVTHSENDGYWK